MNRERTPLSPRRPDHLGAFYLNSTEIRSSEALDRKATLRSAATRIRYRERGIYINYCRRCTAAPNKPGRSSPRACKPVPLSCNGCSTCSPIATKEEKVIEIEDGDVITPYCIPKGDITDRGEVPHKGTAGTYYDMTVNQEGCTSVASLGYRLTNDAIFLAPALTTRTGNAKDSGGADTEFAYSVKVICGVHAMITNCSNNHGL